MKWPIPTDILKPRCLFSFVLGKCGQPYIQPESDPPTLTCGATNGRCMIYCKKWNIGLLRPLHRPCSRPLGAKRNGRRSFHVQNLQSLSRRGCGLIRLPVCSSATTIFATERSKGLASLTQNDFRLSLVIFIWDTVVFTCTWWPSGFYSGADAMLRNCALLAVRCAGRFWAFGHAYFAQ